MSEMQRTPMDDRDDVARLVRLAGRRRPVPQDREERVRAAARAVWLREFRRRFRRRLAFTAAGLAVAASLVLLVALRVFPVGSGLTAGPEPAAVVEALSGTAWTHDGVDGGTPSSRAVERGDELRPGSELATDERSRVAIRIGSGPCVRLASSTHLRWLAHDTISLERGTIYVDSGVEPFSGDGEPLRVLTPLGTIREIGTQFEVRVATDSVRVRLREGEVRVLRGEESHPVRAGTELRLDPDGSVTRRAISTYGPEWDWIVDVTPMLDFEGRSARSFLDWVARERGWTLAFADEDVARRAEEIVLGGTVRQLTLEEALDAVLPTCRMTHRVDQGVLLIGAGPNPRS